MTYFKHVIKKITRKTDFNYPYQLADFHNHSNDILRLARTIKLLIFDVDGVFTNGRLYFDAKGKESKGFHAHDGFGFMQLHQLPITLAVITGRSGGAVKHRIKEQLKVKYAFFGVKNKLRIYKKLLNKFHLKNEQIAFVGDDIPDVHIMERAGLPIAPPNATPYIKHIAVWITPCQGGSGAVRNVADLFMTAYQKNTPG
jgi:3-deoxy-D-manno-octulosonate 8-phosphate phosphatase (KDO 8-P phosphatase)